MSDIEKDLNELNDEIKNNNLSNLYFFYGKENYLKKFYIDKIVNSLLDDNSKDMNYDIITKSEYDFERVKESINTLPFFSEKRIVLFQEVGILTKNELCDVFSNIPKETIVIINEPTGKKEKSIKENTKDSDDKKKKGDLLKIIKSIGKTVEIEQISDSIAVKKVISVAKQNQKIISKDDAQYMITRVGVDLSLLMNELDKLIAYVQEKETITKKDIDEICIQSLESKVFDLIKSICNQNIDLAIKQYHNMITNKEPQVLILYMIARQYMIMYEALLLDAKGYNINQIAEKTEAKQVFVARECLSQGKKYGLTRVTNIIKECLKADISMKSGEDVLELLLYKLMIEK